MKEDLLEWYGRNKRALPWRETTDPYAILVSEVMLQQTQVDRVIPHYLRFVERWPTVAALAAASSAEVIVEWQGLGYNRRAVNLLRAARLVAEHGWPDDLTELPGVGEYTAAAVANFAFGADVLPVDTNIRRVQERTGERFDAACAQALFDLGATICLARIPRCDSCPLATACPSRGSRYEPLRRQSAFEGSFRQRRAQALRAVAAGVATDDGEALAALAADGLVTVSHGRATLPAGRNAPDSPRSPRKIRAVSDSQPNEQLTAAGTDIVGRLIANIETVIHGKSEEIRLVLSALVSGGHVLFEDVPGTAKTVLARAIAGSIDGAVPSRVQCTPDLQPTDVTGLSVFNQEQRKFEFQPGPLFANIILVDEINRAMPKTQSALLEAMAEHQVTVDGVTRKLPDPFLLMATENPIEYEGTFPLPEAQLDRFFLRTSLGYPDEEQELRIVREQRHGHPLDGLTSAVTKDEIGQLRLACEEVYVDALLDEWIVRLVRETRALREVEVGASVRGSLALVKTARAWALLHDRTHVLPEDVEQLFIPVLGHRLMLAPSYLAETRNLTREETLQQIQAQCIGRVPAPRPDWVTESGAVQAARDAAIG